MQRRTQGGADPWVPSCPERVKSSVTRTWEVGMEDPIIPCQRGAHPQQGKARLSGPLPAGDREPGEVSGAQSHLYDGVPAPLNPPSTLQVPRPCSLKASLPDQAVRHEGPLTLPDWKCQATGEAWAGCAHIAHPFPR